MDKHAKIYVAGHRGMVGGAIVRQLQQAGYSNIVSRTHAELDLCNQAAVDAFFAAEKPDYVFLAAAKVGGIHANNVYRGEFIHQNLMIQSNVIDAAHRHGVNRLLFLGSSCIYPRDCPQPIREDYLLTGPLEQTNQPYALAKIAGIEMCWSYNRQYGTRYMAVMPTNLYGPGDNYHPENSHVIPALLRRAHESKLRGDTTFTVWGTGTPMREFLYCEDMAEACVHVMNLDDATYSQLLNDQQPPLLNIGTGQDITIAQLAQAVCDTVGLQAQLVFDTSKPDGTPRKLLDVSKLGALGWQAKTRFADGLQQAYRAAPFYAQ
ncbi:MAG: GDP-L-fucose synthase family protein [Vogesella sp.]|uniref:GDP-L-fucose synthase family protein n=1 Tax=Vogesella sp. TaxID=1904252 RepID=UPI003919E2CF